LRAAGAARPQHASQVCRAEQFGERRQRAPGKHVNEHYDAYLDAVEDHTFSKLHATLAKHERKASREHQMYNGAAGWSTDHRNELADARASPGGRRSKSPAHFGQRESARMNPSSDSSTMGSLLQQGTYMNGLERQIGSDTDRSERTRAPPGFAHPRAPSPRGRAPSPQRTRPDSPRANIHPNQRPASPRGERTSSPGRAPPSARGPRDASPFRQRVAA